MKENNPKYNYKRNILETTPQEINAIICPLSLDAHHPRITIFAEVGKKYQEATLMANFQAMKNRVELGDIYIYEEKNRNLIFFYIKKKFNDPIDKENIINSMLKLEDKLKDTKIKTIGIPEIKATKYNAHDNTWDEIKHDLVDTIKNIDNKYEFTIFEDYKY